LGKIKVKNPIVEIDGDEMARVMWRWIKETLILPYVDVDLKYFDYDIMNRDATDDKVVAECAEAIKKYRIAAKCAAINPDQARVEEFGLKKAWKSPNSGTRNRLGDGTLFRAPIVFSNIPRLVPGWTEPIVVARHAYGGMYGGTDMHIPGHGKVFIRYEAENASDSKELEVHDFVEGPGVALGIFNTDHSIRGFALSCMNYALVRDMPVYLGTKNTELGNYDGRFKDTFTEIYETQFREKFEARGIHFEHRMVDDLAAFAIRSSGGFVWACKNYDGDILSDVVAAGFGSLGLMTSTLLTPDDRIVLTEAAHGTVTRHYRAHKEGKETSSNPTALLFAWTGALFHRGRYDNTPEVQEFAKTLEAACTETVESGFMTGDLAKLAGIEKALTTREFLAKIRENLETKLA
jgi:isocitrate dehydrogenase